MVGEGLKMSLLTSTIDNGLMAITMTTRKRTVEVTQFYDKCPECGKEIVADSEKRLEYQLALHRKLSHGVIRK